MRVGLAVRGGAGVDGGSGQAGHLVEELVMGLFGDVMGLGQGQSAVRGHLGLGVQLMSMLAGHARRRPEPGVEAAPTS
jgi:hypothetical protein